MRRILFALLAAFFGMICGLPNNAVAGKHSELVSSMKRSTEEAYASAETYHGDVSRDRDSLVELSVQDLSNSAKRRQFDVKALYGAVAAPRYNSAKVRTNTDAESAETTARVCAEIRSGRTNHIASRSNAGIGRESEESGFKYEVVGGEAKITKYTGGAADVTIPSVLGGNTVTSIGSQAFYHNKTISSVSIPNTVKTIEDGAFYMSSVASVSIPNSVTFLGSSAFYMSEIESITIPGSVESIGSGAFYRCDNLAHVVIEDGVKTIESTAFAQCFKIGSLALPGSIATIGQQAFSTCSGVTTLIIGDGVQTIDSGAFASCTGLDSVTIPGSVARIGTGAFAYCDLEAVDISEGVTTIGESAFRDNPTLRSVMIPDSVTTIGAQAFAETGITSISIPKSVTSLADNAFEKDNNLETIVYGGTKAQWAAFGVKLDEMSPQIWCAENGEVIGLPQNAVSITSPTNGISVRTGEETTLTLALTSGITVPEGAKLAVGLETNGVSLMSPAYIRANQTSVNVQCTITGTWETAATVTVTSVGGETGYGETQSISFDIYPKPGVTLRSDAADTVWPGETLTITVRGSDIPTDGITGTLTLTGLEMSARDAVQFHLTQTDTYKDIKCIVEDDGKQAEAEITRLQTGGGISLTPPTKLTFALQSAVLPTALPTPTAIQSAVSTVTPLPTLPPLPTVSMLIPVVTATPTASASARPSPTASQSLSLPSAVPTAVPSGGVEPGPVELRTDLPELPPSLEVLPNPEGDGGSILRGPEIGTLWDETTVGIVESWIASSDEENVRIIDTDGKIVPPDQQVATGMIVQVIAPDGSVLQQSTIVVDGDVLGSGDMNLSQLVRMAEAYTKKKPLHGPYAEAANLTGKPNEDGVREPTLTDLVRFAQRYRSDTLDVSYSIADIGEGAILEEAGYDLAPWTSELAVLKADIPAGARVESIAWLQQDFFPGGREQQLYYEGSEENLIFGTYDEGRTVVTTVVTTKAGKVGKKDTEITWSSDDQATAPGASSRSLEDVDTMLVSGIVPANGMTALGSRADASKTGTAPENSSQPSTARPYSEDMQEKARPVRTPRPSASASPAGTPRPTRVPRPTSGATSSFRPTSSAEDSEIEGLMLPTFRADALNACNDLRDLNCIQPALKTSVKLGEVAMVRAKEMAADGELSHTRPDGSKYDTVATLKPGNVIGENIHSNKGYPTPEIGKIAARGWENSAPHRKQMLEPRYSYTGLGFALGKNGRWYCVQVFSNGDAVVSIDTPKA